MASTLAGLQAEIEAALGAAVSATCNTLHGKLSELVQSEFYAQYSPKIYIRTGQLGASPDSEMLSKTKGKIFMNPEGMYYDGTTGSAVIGAAAAGIHGNPAIQTPGRYWETFLSYCSANVVNLIKSHFMG